MPQLKIRVVDKGNHDERLVETRFIDVQSGRRINGATAKKVLQREYPELGKIFVLLKTEGGWQPCEALKPAGNCDYHYVWRYYQVEAA